jgi:LacI family transcriptional regulator
MTMQSIRPPTMRDVAERAGVSLKTVSRVINAEAGVAAETAERVGAAIAELGFQRNDLARSLRQGRSSSTIGLVIEDVGNPFYSAIAQAVEVAAREHGCLLITSSCEEDPERERELVQTLMRRRVDALLIVPASRDHAYLPRAVGGSTPIVFLDRPPEGIEADCVLIDNQGGAAAAVEHLLARGHRRIAYIADPDALYTAAERLAGYRQAMAAAHAPIDPELVRFGSHDAAQAEAVVRELLALPDERRPTALFCGNNRHTVGALHALRGRDEPLALVGFDDFELADLLGTTVVCHDSQELGLHAAALAFGRLEGENGPPRRVIVQTRIVARGSGEVPPS